MSASWSILLPAGRLSSLRNDFTAFRNTNQLQAEEFIGRK
jgi:hypothetical protein